MVKNFFLFIFLVLILFVLGSCSALVHTNPDKAFKTRFKTDLKEDPALVHGILENGFRYYLYKNSTPENRVSMHLDVLAGSYHENKDQSGLAHFLEHMLFNGSAHFKPGELVEYFQSIGMAFGADANAHTGFFETVYDLSLPRGDKKSIKDGLLVIDDYARGALLLPSEIKKERGIILAEKRDRDSVSYRTFKESMKFELSGSRIIERYPIGLEDTIKNASQALLKDFYDTWYRPDNMILIIAGDFDLALTAELIKERFKDLKPRGKKRVVPSNTWDKHTGIKVFYHHEVESSSTNITIETISRVEFKQQTFDSLKERIKNNIANSILDNRLSRLLAKKNPPFSDIGVSSGVYLRNIAYSSIYAETTPDNWRETLSTLDISLRSALEFGFTEKELKRAKAEYINELEDQVKKSSTRKSNIIAAGIIYHLNNKKVFQSPETRLTIVKPFIQALKLEDINKSFIKSWHKGHRLILVTGNGKIADNRKDAEDIILACYTRSLKSKAPRYKDSSDVKFPYLPVPAAFNVSDEINKSHGLIKSKKHIPQLGITTIDFKNMLRLNLKKTQFKKGEFIFNAAVKGGRVTEPEAKPGLSIIAEELLNESGFGRVNKEELREILAGTSVDIGFSVEGDSFNFHGQGEPSELKLVFQLIHTYLNDPGFREESLDLVKKRYEQDFNSFLRTPSGLMYIKGNKFLAGGDHRFGYPKVELIKNITCQDVREWLMPFFKKAGLEISIVGDFNLKEAEELTLQYFGALPSRDSAGLNLKKENILRFPKGETLTLKMDTKVKKSEIRLAFLTDDFWDIPQTRAMNLLSSIFSERFRKIIREEMGLAYSTYVYNNPSAIYRDYGVLNAVVLADPEKTDIVLDKMKEITRLLSDKGVTEKELELVRKPLLNYIRDMQQTNSYWLNSVLSGSLDHPEKFEWAGNIFDDYSSVSFKTISFLAKKFLDLGISAEIIIKAR